MKNLKMIVFAMILSSSLWAKPDCTPVEILSGTIVNKTLDANQLYRVSGDVSITGNFTVPAGTVITFDNGDNLYFEKGSYAKIEGTELEPVIFTSAAAPGSRVPLTGAGVYFLGEAPLNESSLELPRGNAHVSGNLPNDNSGIIENIHVNFLSGSLGYDNMDFGLSFIGVGNLTSIQNIQVSRSANSGLAAFGGEANMKGLFLLDNSKNNMLVAYGYTAEISEILSINKDPLAIHIDGTNGLVIWNNDFDDHEEYTPLTNPIIRNSTFMGFKSCGLIEKGSGIIIDFNGGGYFVDNVIDGFETGLLIHGDLSIGRTNNTPTLIFDFSSFANNVINYDYIGTWSGNGCDLSMTHWIEGSGTEACNQLQNQFAVSPLGYDGSFCGDFCAINFEQTFVIDVNSDLLPPSGEDDLNFRGAIQEVDLFTWIQVCPPDFVICNPLMLQKTRQLEVYPNPAMHVATVDFEVKSTQIVHVRVMEMVTGRILYKTQIQVEEGKQSVNIPTQTWKEGVYNVQIQMNEEFLHGKLSVK